MDGSEKKKFTINLVSYWKLSWWAHNRKQHSNEELQNSSYNNPEEEILGQNTFWTPGNQYMSQES